MTVGGGENIKVFLEGKPGSAPRLGSSPLGGDASSQQSVPFLTVSPALGRNNALGLEDEEELRSEETVILFLTKNA